MAPEIRTSASHPLVVGWLPAQAVGRVGLTLAPGRGPDAQPDPQIASARAVST